MNSLALEASRLRIPSLPWLVVLLAGVWTWAIWSCAEHWQGNPNYSYGWAVPLLALGFALRRYLQIDPPESAGAPPEMHMSILSRTAFALLAGGTFFVLAYSREQMWHPEIVLWLI
jgi:hypothetical protein